MHRQLWRTAGQAGRTSLLFLAISVTHATQATQGLALDIVLSYSATVSGDPEFASISAAATAAAAHWESLFTDPITIKFAVDFDPGLPATALGYFDVDTPGVTVPLVYGLVKSKLAADITSPADFSAVTSLQPGPAIDMITNVTDPFGAPPVRIRETVGKPYNTTLRLTRANMKALDLLPPHDGAAGADGTLFINPAKVTSGDFDYIQAGGITAGKVDATAVFAHEFAHGMGFIGGVDHIDYSAYSFPTPPPGHPHPYGPEVIFTPLDLFRYSEDSVTAAMQPATGAVNDWAMGSATVTDNPYFSIDGGATPLGLFATGVYHGDGSQSQHWKDEFFVFPTPALGLMDPDIASGELGLITELDRVALDVIGYNRLIPEPSGVVLMAIGMGILAGLRRRRSELNKVHP